MADLDDRDYYQVRREHLLEAFDQQASLWRSQLATSMGDPAAALVLERSRQNFNRLIPRLPYIGGDTNHLTTALIDAARCLAFFQAMQSYGKSPAEAGYILYQTELERPPDPRPNGDLLPLDELMDRRRQRATRSQERRYAWDYVYSFIPGDGHNYDYGYNFVQCAAQKFYKAQRGEAFLSYYCCLDFVKCAHQGLRLQRTSTLADGGDVCDFRFRVGAALDDGWPPPCLSLSVPSSA